MLKERVAEPGRSSGCPPEVRQQLLDAIYAGRPFRAVLSDLELTPNRVWGLAKTDDEWSAALEGGALKMPDEGGA